MLLPEVDLDAGLDKVGPAEIVDHDVVDAAQCLKSDQLDVVEVHVDIGDVPEEAHVRAVGRDVDVLGDVGAVEVEPVQAVLALDGVVAVARIPLEDVVAGAEESDVVARAAVDDIVTAATVSVSAPASPNRTLAPSLPVRTSPWLLPNRFSMPLSVSPAAPPLPRPVARLTPTASAEDGS